MTPARFAAITEKYPSLRVAIAGDFCLDRYLEIDPARHEVSLETGLPVHNVMRVRSQPGGAGTILNNLAALGVGTIYPIGFAGFDGEGFELWQALERCPGVRMPFFTRTTDRCTFTYCKPLLVALDKPPVELNRLDSKNWTPTPALLQGLLVRRLEEAAELIDVLIVLDQVDIPDTGVVTQRLLTSVKEMMANRPNLVVMADSRRSLRDFPPTLFKMNAAELAALTGAKAELGLEEIKAAAIALAGKNGKQVFITMAERGILGATPTGEVAHVPALPVRGPIDVVGAGDAVSANLVTALAAGASLPEALELANAASSVVIHKLGTTGTASVAEIGFYLGSM